ncbi:MAG: hypothetical protein GXP51_05410 [Deltaproteobacteria bacterium]|nr:hypothetical protein [Deltaproteobacteria bacterium]
MGWLGKIFGGGASLEGLRKAVEQERFADARLLAEQVLGQPLAEAEIAEANRLQAAAGDGLARLNLNEGLGFQRSGNTELAAEHLQLALQQVCSADLRREIEQAAETPLIPVVETPVKDCSSESCAGCGPQEPVPPADTELALPDRDSQLELVLTSYPPPLVERYRGKSELFLQAFLLSHAGQDEVALPIWQQLPADDQDELYWFELGAVQARCGHGKEGRESLEKALQIDPGFLLAGEALVSLLISLDEADSALQHLHRCWRAGRIRPFAMST